MTQIKRKSELAVAGNCSNEPAPLMPTLRAACSHCNLRELCLPLGLTEQEVVQLDHIVSNRRRIKRGQALYRTGDPFTALHVVKIGFFKSSVTMEDGRDQVTGFQMAGEILGMDGISNDIHTCDAIALEDGEVCSLPFAELEQLSSQIRSLQHHLHKVMSREIIRDHGVMMLLGTMRAEERLAAFLLNLSQRFASRGYAAHEFHLRMNREEIGSFLGLKLETVSRAFSKFQDEGLISVQQKHICILDAPALKELVTPKH